MVLKDVTNIPAQYIHTKSTAVSSISREKSSGPTIPMAQTDGDVGNYQMGPRNGPGIAATCLNPGRPPNKNSCLLPAALDLLLDSTERRSNEAEGKKEVVNEIMEVVPGGEESSSPAKPMAL